MSTRLKRTLTFASLLSTSLWISAPSFAEEASSTEADKNAFDMTANNFSYSKDGQTITADGNVQIISSYGSIWANHVTYSVADKSVKAVGDVIYADENNLTVFLEEMTIDNKMKTAVLQKLRMETHNGESAPRLVAEHAERLSENVLELENIAYSPCQTCNVSTDKELPWKIRAEKVRFDGDKGHMTYDNAYIDIYGTPVLYMPWFRHPIKDRAVNGLLPPSFGTSTANGFKLASAYYYRFNDQKDTTIRAAHFSKRGTQIAPEFRFAGEHLYTELRGSAIDDKRTQDIRSHFQTKTEYRLSPGRRLGFVGEFATDDNYIYDFFDRNDAYLSTDVYFEDASTQHYMAASATRYQDLRQEASADETPHITPHLVYEKTFYVDEDPSQNVTTLADISALTRTDGDEIQRLVTGITYENTHFTENGHRFVFNASLRGDIYHVDAEETDTDVDDGFHPRALPQLALTWDHAYISSDSEHKITPKAMLVVAPGGNNPEEIPNEDSLEYDMDTNNIFSTNRFAGFDRFETGSRFVYGLDNHWGSADNIQWRAFFGQSLRFQHDENLERASNESARQSDIVAIFEGDPHKNLSFSSDLRMDPSDLNASRMNNSLRIGEDDYRHLSLEHTFVEDGPAELRLNGKYTFNNEWAFEAETRKDLNEDGRTLISKGSVIWTDQCYRIAFSAQRSGYDNDTVKPATEYTVNLELLTFGRE